MPKLIMQQDSDGSPDGIHVRHYRAGEEYDIDTPSMPMELAKVFVNEIKVAKAVRNANEADLDAIETAVQPTNKKGSSPAPSETK